MTQHIRRFGVAQTAKVFGVLYAIIGLLLAPFFVLAAVFAPEEAGFGMAFAVLLPILYGLLGFVGVALVCLIYNAVAGIVGGIEVEIANPAS
jgi:hypothetical protein